MENMGNVTVVAYAVCSVAVSKPRRFRIRSKRRIILPRTDPTVGIGYCDHLLVTLVSVLIGYCYYFPNSQKPISVL